MPLNSPRILAVIAAIFGSLTSTSSNATNYLGDGYAVGVVRPGGDRPCTLFTLAGVANSDPVLPGSSWFVIEPTAPAYKEMVATLLAAKASGRNIQVITTGTISSSCGHPVVSVLMWP